MGFVAVIAVVMWVASRCNPWREPSASKMFVLNPINRNDSNPLNRSQSGPTDHEKLSPIGGESKLSTKDIYKLAVGTLTPEQARKLLERVDVEIIGINDRALASSIIIQALCKQGYTKEAWNLITNEQGMIRASEIGAFFGGSGEPLETLLTKLNLIDDPTERSTAISCLVRSRSEEIVGLDFSRLPLNSDQDTKAVVSAIAYNLSTKQEAETSRALLGKAISLLTEGKLNVGNLLQILGSDNANNAFYQWDMVAGLKTSVSTEDFERLNRALVRKLVTTDPDKAMELLTTSQTTKNSYPVLSLAIDQLYNNAPKEANAWVTSHLPNLDPATGQRIIVSVAQVAIKDADFITAQKWADQLTNPRVQQDLLNDISGAQQARRTKQGETPKSGRK